MIKFLYGTYGSGKTHSVIQAIKNDTANGKHTFLIVPEQEVVQSERATLNEIPAASQLELEVLSFSRLYNRLCREYGGLCYRYATKPIKHLIMWQTLRELDAVLEEYSLRKDKDLSTCEVLLSAISECKASAITSTDVINTANKLPDDSPLRKRLTELYHIYVNYDRLISENYSDASDDISRLYELLEKEHFFRGKNVYIDSFTSFTAAEHKVIERIFADADSVTVTIPLPSPDYDDISVMSIRSSQERLIDAAKSRGGFEAPICLTGNKRAKSKVLAHISDNLWRLDVSGGNGTVVNDGSVCAEICETPYAEAEATANHILELMRSGIRCKDVLVLMRSPENYKGIIEPAFEKNGIPYYFSDKTDLNSLPPVKLLFSALRIKQFGWQKNDIITHIKTGIYSLPIRSCDLFEEYLNTWNIHGKMFYEGDGWTMNPDGYTAKISERGKDILTSANTVRRVLLDVLERFFIRLDAANTVADMCRAVYGYFTDIELEKRMTSLAHGEQKRGNIKTAKELDSIYGIMLETLADIGTALSEEEVSVEEFTTILRTVFDSTDIGTIPTSVDEVTIGSAATLRASNPKYTFVLGLCEGEFPATVNDKGLLSATEKAELKGLGFELSSDIDTRSSDELMYAQRAFASPSDGLYILTHVAKFGGETRTSSIPFNRVIALLKDYEAHRFSGNDISYLVGSPKSASTHLKVLGNTAKGNALKYAIDKHLPDTKRLSDLPISAGDYTLTPESVDLALGKNVSFSSTTFENYVKCPMMYYCKNVLGLREKVNSDFLSSDMGTFVHFVLEKMIRYALVPDGETGELPTDAEIIEKTEQTVLDYIDRISPLELKKSKKLSHVYKRLKDLASLMVKNIITEFSESDFTPEYFELKINGEGDNPKPMEFTTDDDFNIKFTGTIDRVDIYKKKDGDGSVKVYIRVIDYKTGTKVFSLDDVEHGINTQMLLYLFMLCKNPDSRFRESLGLKEDEEPTTAGIMYLSANISTVLATGEIDENTARSKAEGSLKRSGLLLDDPEILAAMNRKMTSKFLAGISKPKPKKKGDPEVIIGDALTSADEFERLYEDIKNTIFEITNKLRCGKAGATPLRYNDVDPCTYCKMRAVCRTDGI